MINIKTVQYDSTSKEQDVIELRTEGKYYQKNDAKYLIYEETELSGLLGTTTKIKIKDNQVELRRIGEHESAMSFQKDKRFQSVMPTPVGNIPLEIMTNSIRFDMLPDPLSLKLEFEYSIALKGLFQGKNLISIEATRMK
ncbi:MAG: DUF1934 domain-containing protein [Peptostreptococcaceae bacterium]|nr:DUF1934 domain-containing protein [Peptostreptococcaceae bacterium]